jgi:hypothetical protein
VTLPSGSFLAKQNRRPQQNRNQNSKDYKKRRQNDQRWNRYD